MPVIPPIKSQGIKTKIVDLIRESAKHSEYDRWVEPFMGTGVVAFNIKPRRALLCDSNPHIIEFYNSMQQGKITAAIARDFLQKEGACLFQSNGKHYYTVRERFNEFGNPLDFLFLSRACFNGMMRFNKSGKFNVPFCKKPHRFSKALITKICNQIASVSFIIGEADYEFKHQQFEETLKETHHADLVYCDPPYVGRHTDYFDSWSEEDEASLNDRLVKSGVKFILSTWVKNKYRTNPHVFSTWGDCRIVTKEHFYHVGASEKNRNSITEALLTNYATSHAMPVCEYPVNTPTVNPATAIPPTGEKQAMLL